MLKEFDIVEDRPAQEKYFNTYQAMQTHQLLIVTSTVTMIECNMGFFHGNESAYLLFCK